MHLGALTTKRFAIAAAATALTFFLLGLLASQAGAASGGVGSGGASASTATTGGSTERVGTKYERIWRRLSVGDKRWARSTWAASPKSPGGDPIAYPYRTQAVVAVLLKRRDGAGHWPVCGR